MELTETELVNACLLNDRKAQCLLYERYKRAMVTKAFRILNDYDLANDALQDAFVEVFRDLKNFKFQSTLGAWIKIIVLRNALKIQRFEAKFETFQDIHDQEIYFSDELTGEVLDKAIRSLPDACRAVFLLIEVEGFQHKEVAEMLEISEGTSKSQLNYAKKLLQKRLTFF